VAQRHLVEPLSQVQGFQSLFRVKMTLFGAFSAVLRPHRTPMTPFLGWPTRRHRTLFRNHPHHSRFHLDNTAITTTIPPTIIKKIITTLSNVGQTQPKKSPRRGPRAKDAHNEQRRSKCQELPLAHLQSTLYTSRNEVRKGPAHAGSLNRIHS
jgi:hypothetical protein